MTPVCGFAVVFSLIISMCGGASNPDSGLTPEEETEFLTRHNHFRREQVKRHGGQNVNRLVWDRHLAKTALDWAKTCQFKHGMPESAGGEEYGQNLYWVSGVTNKYGSVNTWYNEYRNYDMTTGRCREGRVCGHYTQVVWGTSKRLGCAHYLCDKLFHPEMNKYYDNAHHIVCHYDPPGNFPKPPFSAGRPCSKCPGGQGFCDDGLCVDTCPSGSKCECNTQCENCEGLNRDTCSCSCKFFTGTYCTEPCMDRDPRCGTSYPSLLCTNPSYAKYRPLMEKKCPATCGICNEPDETWSCGKTTKEERFTSGRYVGYQVTNGYSGQCVFPFSYGGVQYDRCTLKDSAVGKPWCGTNEGSSQYGTCVQVPTYQGDQPGTPCHFPFLYNKEKYYQCITDDDGYSWCGLSEDYDTETSFGYCNTTAIL